MERTNSARLSRDEKITLVEKVLPSLQCLLKRCSACPRGCRVDRTQKKAGYCRAGLESVVYSYCPHHGEEPVLSGTKGSGTIFFSYCNMKCAYCQNYYFSQLDRGEEVSIERLSQIMLYLQRLGCHNINLVSPTHYVPQIVAAIHIALEKGLVLPIVYNSGGYDDYDTLRSLDGIIDIYMPDMRYSDPAMALKYSDAPDYRDRNRWAVREMQRQVGDLIIKDGVAVRGLIIRLLALPNDISGTKNTLRFIKEEVSTGAYLSLMSQYHPTFKAYNYPELSRGVSRAEYKNIVDEALRLGLNNGWVQDIPDPNDTAFLGTNIKPISPVRE